MIVRVELSTMSEYSVLDTVVISGEDICCSGVWHSGGCVDAICY